MHKLTKLIKTHIEFIKRRKKAFRRIDIVKFTPGTNDSIIIKGKIVANRSLDNPRILIRKFREDEISFTVPLKTSLRLDRFAFLFLRLISGYRAVDFECEINPNWSELPHSIYNINFRTDGGNGGFYFKRHKHLVVNRKDGSGTHYIFFDNTARSLRIENLNINKTQLRQLKAYSKSPETSNLAQCIIGEYPICARDNGWALFEAIRKGGIFEDPRIKSTYPIEKKNQDNIAINHQDIIEWGSYEHLKRCIEADVIAFSHDRINVYPQILKVIAPKKYQNIRSFWLQHGVMALKRICVNHYNKKKTNFSSVNTSSDWEKSVFIKHFGFTEDEVVVCGLSRQDRLIRMNEMITPDANKIVIFPTWRNGLARLSHEDFKKTEYFTQWAGLAKRLTETSIGNEKLHVTFIPHPMLVDYAHLFEDYATEVDIASNFQTRLLEASALITDYSSICFEPLFVNRQAFFFMFDAADYGIRNDAFLNVDEELFGPVSENIEGMVKAVEEWRTKTADDDSTPYNRKIEFYKNNDDRSSQRMADNIVRLSNKTFLQKHHQEIINFPHNKPTSMHELSNTTDCNMTKTSYKNIR